MRNLNISINILVIAPGANPQELIYKIVNRTLSTHDQPPNLNIFILRAEQPSPVDTILTSGSGTGTRTRRETRCACSSIDI